MRVDQCVSAVRAVGVPILVCLRSSCSHVTELRGDVGFVRLALKVAVQNEGDFMDIILLYLAVKLRTSPVLFLCHVA